MSVVQPFAIDAGDGMAVSDHAVLRWLERVCGVDIEAYRETIRAALAAGGFSPMTGASEAAVYIDVPIHAVHLVVRTGQVVTVIPQDGGGDE